MFIFAQNVCYPFCQPIVWQACFCLIANKLFHLSREVQVLSTFHHQSRPSAKRIRTIQDKPMFKKGNRPKSGVDREGHKYDEQKAKVSTVSRNDGLGGNTLKQVGVCVFVCTSLSILTTYFHSYIAYQRTITCCRFQVWNKQTLNFLNDLKTCIMLLDASNSNKRQNLQ